MKRKRIKPPYRDEETILTTVEEIVTLAQERLTDMGPCDLGQIAEEAGKCLATVERFLAGQTKHPWTDTSLAILEALGIRCFGRYEEGLGICVGGYRGHRRYHPDLPRSTRRYGSGPEGLRAACKPRR